RVGRAAAAAEREPEPDEPGVELLADHQVALEYPVARIALEKRRVADVVALGLGEIVNVIAADQPAATADHVDGRDRIAGVAGSLVEKLVVFDDHVVGPDSLALGPGV